MRWFGGRRVKIAVPRLQISAKPSIDQQELPGAMEILRAALRDADSVDPGGLLILETVVKEIPNLPEDERDEFVRNAYSCWCLGASIHKVGEGEKFRPSSISSNTWSAVGSAPGYLNAFTRDDASIAWFTVWKPYFIHCGLNATHLRRAKPDTDTDVDEVMKAGILGEIERVFAENPTFPFTK